MVEMNFSLSAAYNPEVFKISNIVCYGVKQTNSVVIKTAACFPVQKFTLVRTAFEFGRVGSRPNEILWNKLAKRAALLSSKLTIKRGLVG